MQYCVLQHWTSITSHTAVLFLRLHPRAAFQTLLLTMIATPRDSCLLLLLSRFSRVRLCATPWTAAHQAPPTLGFSRQEYWSGLPFPSPEDLPNPGIEPTSPALQADSLPAEPQGKPSGNTAAAAAAAKSLQSCPTLCNPRDGSPPGSPVPGILQERILEWVAISFFIAWK